MDFELNDTQLMFRNMAKEFVEREVKPIAQEFDRKVDPKESVPLELIRKGFEQDFHKMVVPTKYGGLGLDAVTSVLILEELAAGDPGFALVWHVNNVALTFLSNLGTEEQAEEFIRPLMGAEPGIAAVSTNEPNMGVTSAQLVDPVNFVFETTARLDRDEWLINGDKNFCSNGGLPFTKWVMTFCRNDMTKTGLTATGIIIVPTDTPGFRLIGEEDKMGHRLANSQSIKYDNVRVPKKNLVAGGKRTVTFEHDSAVAAIALGCARTAYEAAVDYAKQRTVLGKPIINYQLMQAKIADMYIGLEAIRSLIWRTASYSDTHPQMDQKLARAVKVFGSETANRVVSDALQIFGGSGYSKGTTTEKCYRDARITMIYEGTNEVLRISLSQLIEKGL